MQIEIEQTFVQQIYLTFGEISVISVIWCQRMFRTTEKIKEYNKSVS